MHRIASVLCVAASGALLGCNPTAGNNRSAVNLVVTEFNSDGETRSGLFVDVVSDSGTPTDETLFVKVRAVSKTAAVPPANFYSVEIQAYQVSFARLDGRNEPGVDVPFPRTLSIHSFVQPEQESEFEILIVPRDAKNDAPLRSLWFSNQRITTTMFVTVFGRDLVGNTLTADSSLPAIFGDFPG